MSHVNFGKWGEDCAVDFILNKGYRIVARNYRHKIGEIDIVAFDNDELCFIEVKTRLNLNKGFPFESVDFRKQNQLRKMAHVYLKDRYNTCAIKVRFDVISILKIGEDIDIKFIKNAF